MHSRRKVPVTQVLSGFFIIWLIIAVGYGVGRTGALGQNAQPVLSRVAFFVASPALLFNTLSNSDVFLVLGPQLWIATISAGIAADMVPIHSRSEEHTSALQSRGHLVCRLLLDKKKMKTNKNIYLKK